MRKQRQIHADPERPTLRSTVAAASEPLRSAAWVVEERFVLPGAERLRRIGEVARWPFERLAWTVERVLVWPLRERAAGHDLPRGTGAATLATAAIAAGGLVIVLASGSGGGGEPLTAPNRVAVVTDSSASPAPGAAPDAPVLRGAAPSFGVGKGVGIAKAPAGADAGEGSAATATTPAEPAAASEEAGATTSSSKPVPAGPAAMKVARRFADAFVYYEIGERTERARSVFAATATPRLAGALAERPPRLPQSAKVPRARVLNLVPGPRRGKAYTVSVSLLRVGLTSELRLEMEKKDGSWTVTDVRG